MVVASTSVTAAGLAGFLDLKRFFAVAVTAAKRFLDLLATAGEEAAFGLALATSFSFSPAFFGFTVGDDLVFMTVVLNRW